MIYKLAMVAGAQPWAGLKQLSGCMCTCVVSARSEARARAIAAAHACDEGPAVWSDPAAVSAEVWTEDSPEMLILSDDTDDQDGS